MDEDVGAAVVFARNFVGNFRGPESQVVNFCRLQIVVNGDAIFSGVNPLCKMQVLCTIKYDCNVILLEPFSVPCCEPIT